MNKETQRRLPELPPHPPPQGSERPASGLELKNVREFAWLMRKCDVRDQGREGSETGAGLRLARADTAAGGFPRRLTQLFGEAEGLRGETGLGAPGKEQTVWWGGGRQTAGVGVGLVSVHYPLH